jgi:steroid delta-isomerase-like uncharacterized protein
MRVRRFTSVTIETTEIVLIRTAFPGGRVMSSLKQVITTYTQEVWNDHRVAAIDTYYAADYRHHDVSRPDVTTLADYKAWSSALQAGVPDITVGIDDLIAEGEMAVKRWTASGTHRGELAGLPPTNKPVRFSGVSIYRFRNGRIVESWYIYDLFGLLQQLGPLPAPEAAAR